jgi:hypothetical protein
LIQARPAEIRAHTRFLADDALEGREAGSRGDRIAMLYIAERMAAAGLEPAGDGDSFFQPFRMRTTTLVPGSARFTLSGPGGERHFANGEEVVVFGSPLEPELDAETGLVFAGHGISDPARRRDDYAGLDVRGRTVVVLGGPAPFLPAAEAAHYASSDQQRLAAERHGAVGLIQLWTPALEERFPWSAMAGLLARRDMAPLDAEGRPRIAAAPVRLRAFAHGAAAEALFAGSGRSLARLMEQARRGPVRGFALRTRLRLASRSRHEDGAASANVVGLLRGSDPQLAGEAVVLSAHFDHVGLGPAVDGDTIHNGALDNAIGTAGLLEIARLLAAAPRPRRSILFLAAGAEEKGLLGSDHFAARMTGVGRPAGTPEIVANVNLDGIMPFYDFSDVIAFGAEQSQMGDRLAAAVRGLGLDVAADPFPAEGLFTRSDQYSFVRRGIPSLFLYVGFTDLAGRNVGRRWWDDLNRTIVHQPSDDVSQPIDYAIAAKFTDLVRRVLLETANDPERPRWHAASLFAPPAPD